MGRANSHRPLNYEGRIRFQVIPCGICGGKIGTGTGFYPEYFGIPCKYHFTNASYSFFRRSYKTLAAESLVKQHSVRTNQDNVLSALNSRNQV